MSFFLIFCVMSSSFSVVLVHTGFELNKKYIVEKLCENRDRPWMQCQGKCILANKLKAAQEREAKEMYKAPQHEAILIHCASPVLFFKTCRGQDSRLDDFKFVYFYLEDIFHPPIVSV